MTYLEAVGLILLGAFLGRLFEVYVMPIFDIWIGKKTNEFTKQTTQLQQEIYEIQEQSQPINSNLIGFQTSDYEEEYYEDDE